MVNIIKNRKTNMKRYVVQRLIIQSFRQYGRFVARHPIWFLVFPVILTAILATGIVRARSLRDIENLTVPFNSRAIRERNIVEKLFPMNISKDFDITRITRLGRYASIIVLAKDGGGVLRKEIFRDIIAIDHMVKNISIRRNNNTWDYSQLCCERYNQCADFNMALKLDSKLNDFHRGLFKFRHPFDLDPLTYKLELYGLNLGGITKDSNGYVKDAKAFRLMYYLDDQSKELQSILLWQENFEKTMQNAEFSKVSIAFTTSSTVVNELKAFTNKLFPLGTITFVVILIFSVISFMTTNWITSKPCLGLAACVNVLLSVVSAFGCVMHFDVEYIDVNVALVFIMLGIGLDDSFILLSSWRRTNRTQGFIQRMENAYSEAAVSITITSLTDFFSFLICIFNPFPIVHIFCIYASVAVLFTYVYQITFFGACMALSGRKEEQNPDPLVLCHSTRFRNKDQEDEVSQMYISNKCALALINKVRHIHSKRITRYLALAVFSGLIAVGIYGTTTLEEGLEAKDIFSINSKSFIFTERFYKYYTDYAHRIHIIVNQPLNYANQSVQNEIEDIINRFEEKAFICKSWCTESWLKFYLNFSTSEISWFSLRGYNLTQEMDFIAGLRNVFLKFPQSKMLNQDLVYDQNFTKIMAARFFVNTLDVSNKASEKEMLETIWNIADQSSLPITTFALWFPAYEQLLFIRPLTIQSLITAAIVIFIIFVIFVPDLLSAVCVSVVTFSIQIEVIGLMSLWGVKLDILTLLMLVMCIGFALNYPAHVCFAFALSTAHEANDRIKQAMNAVSLPILQGSVTTILGVAVLGFQDKYFMILFFKIISLVVLLVAVHSLFILPTALAFVTQFSFTKKIYYDDHHIPRKDDAHPMNSAV